MDSTIQYSLDSTIQYSLDCYIQQILDNPDPFYYEGEFEGFLQKMDELYFLLSTETDRIQWKQIKNALLYNKTVLPLELYEMEIIPNIAELGEIYNLREIDDCLRIEFLITALINRFPIPAWLMVATIRETINFGDSDILRKSLTLYASYSSCYDKSPYYINYSFGIFINYSSRIIVDHSERIELTWRDIFANIFVADEESDENIVGVSALDFQSNYWKFEEKIKMLGRGKVAFFYLPLLRQNKYSEEIGESPLEYLCALPPFR